LFWCFKHLNRLSGTLVLLRDHAPTLISEHPGKYLKIAAEAPSYSLPGKSSEGHAGLRCGMGRAEFTKRPGKHCKIIVALGATGGFSEGVWSSSAGSIISSSADNIEAVWQL